MYLKSDQDKHQKIADLWCWAVSRGVYNCDEFDWMDAASVSAPEWTIKGWIQRFV